MKQLIRIQHHHRRHARRPDRTLPVVDRRRRDPHNFAPTMKHVIDGLVITALTIGGSSSSGGSAGGSKTVTRLSSSHSGRIRGTARQAPRGAARTLLDRNETRRAATHKASRQPHSSVLRRVEGYA